MLSPIALFQVDLHVFPMSLIRPLGRCFKYARSKTKVKSTVGPLLDDNDKHTCDDHDMGQMLNAFFASVFTARAMLALQALY